MANSTDRANFWVPDTVANDGVIRAVFKIYLLIIIIIIVVVGNKCLALWVKHKLLRGKTVYVTDTTGWLHGPPLAKAAFDVRKLPGGWLGWLMLLVTILDQVGEYGVAITVKAQLRTTTKVFEQGGLMNPDTLTSSPSASWEAFRWAAAAQTNSYRNANQTNMATKHYGIYRMITNDTHFMATPEDTIGYWSCSSNTTTPLIYDQKWKGSAEEVYDYDIWTDLYVQGKLYDGYQAALATANVSMYDNSSLSYGPATHTTIITASNYSTSSLFNISAAIDIKDIDDKGSKQMYVFHCILRATDTGRTVESIARTINPYATLTNWIPIMRGAFFPGLFETESYPIQDLEVTLQYYLNAMIMVSGASETVTTPNTPGYDLGVVYRATKIPVWILLICVVIFLIAALLTCLCVYLAIAARAAGLLHDSRNKDGICVPAREIHENTPIGMLDWMAHAAYESRDVQQIPKWNSLKGWIVSTTWHAGRRLAIVRGEEVGQVNPAKTPTLGVGTPGPYYGQGHGPVLETGYFSPSQSQMKGEYIALNTREVLN